MVDTLNKLVKIIAFCDFSNHQMTLTIENITSTGIDTNPPPNGIDISGEAVALNCTAPCSSHRPVNTFIASKCGTKTKAELPALITIPDYPLGMVPDELRDNEPILYRCIIAKRALVAGYEDAEDESSVTDLLADVRHYCDALGLDYAVMDQRAHSHYLAEIEDQLELKIKEVANG